VADLHRRHGDGKHNKHMCEQIKKVQPEDEVPVALPTPEALELQRVEKRQHVSSGLSFMTIKDDDRKHHPVVVAVVIEEVE
jgi:hypothetical protein